MQTSHLLLSTGRIAVVMIALLGTSRGHAQKSIILKDGFVLQGNVKKSGTTIVDAYGSQQVWIPQGAFYIDDAVRRMYFPHGRVEAIEDRTTLPEGQIQRAPVVSITAMTYQLPPLLGVVEAGPWNEKWSRPLKVRTSERQLSFTQHLAILSPHYAYAFVERRPDTTRNYSWGAMYLTRELPPEEVRSLLALHPDLKVLKDKPDEDNFNRRQRAIQFLMQLGRHDLANEELEQLRKDLPSQTEKIDAAAEGLRRVKALALFDDIKQAQTAGRHDFAQKKLADFPEKDADERLLAQVQALKARYEAAAENLKLARRYLCELPLLVKDDADRRLFIEACSSISDEVTVEHLLKQRENDQEAGRLDTFLRFTQLAERQRKQGMMPQYEPAQLLAFAVTGWLLGSSSAEDKADTARRLWKARQFALKYLRTPEADKRKALLHDYEERGSDAARVDEMAQLLGSLPPETPERIVSSGPLEYEVEPSRGSGRPVKYLVQPPPEYHPGRTYPVLFALHDGGEKARDALGRWGKDAGLHGYLLVAPEWEDHVDGLYHYSFQEHAAVTDVLRDLRRRFAVDSDRVFVTGLGQGGNMAFDVGLSHPDLFAGVLPMAGVPGPFAQFHYWRNGQYLPFYVVSGDWIGDSRKEVRAVFDDWISRGYPMMWVEYKGRGVEWFGGEVAPMFDWMGRKKRAAPLAELGRNPNAGPLGQEFRTMRSGDNRFYWLSTDGIQERCLNESSRYDSRVPAAAVQARIGEGNQVAVHAFGLRQLTVWLGRGMIDFDKPMTIAVNLQARWANRKVTPSLGVLLEDLYQRGDRQRLFVAKVELDKL